AVDLVEAYCKEQSMFVGPESTDPEFSDTLELDLGTVEPSLAGPRRPQDRVPLPEMKRTFRRSLYGMLEKDLAGLSGEFVQPWLNEGGSADKPPAQLVQAHQAHLGKLVSEVPIKRGDVEFPLRHGAVVIAAITSCTNTSNPAVMLGAGLLAKKAV